MSKAPKQSVLPSSPADQLKLKGHVEEIVQAKIKNDLNNSFIRDVKKTVRDNFDVTPALFNQLVSARHKMVAQEIRDKNEEFDIFYGTLFEINQDSE